MPGAAVPGVCWCISYGISNKNASTWWICLFQWWFFLVAQTPWCIFHVFCNSYYCLNRALRRMTRAYTCSYGGYCKATWSHCGDLFQSCALQELMKNICCELGLGAARSTGREDAFCSALWGFGQVRLWRKERLEGRDKSKNLRLFGDALHLKLVPILVKKHQDLKELTWYFLEQVFIFLYRWDQRIRTGFFMYFLI